MAELKTRIILRNDSSSNWLINKSQVLLKGEMGIEFDDTTSKAKIKIGDGTKTWEQLEYYNEELKVNENVFGFDGEGKLDLYGFAEAVEGAQLLKGADGKLQWVKPDGSTIEGIETIVAGLQDDIKDINTTLTDLTGKVGAAAEGETPATGLFAELDKKANAADVYTKTETESAIATAIADAPHLERKQVASIDEIVVDAPDAEKFIYMVPKADVADGNAYDEYMVIGGALEFVGDWAVDLTDYVTTDSLAGTLAGYVPAVEGSRLMTDAEGTKLAAIADGAQVNVIDTVDEAQFAIEAEGKKLTLLDVAMGKVTGLETALAGKVDVVEGSRLMTEEEATTLAGLATAQDTAIKNIKLNGTLLEVVDNTVDVVVPLATQAAAGLVKSSTEENKVAVAADGTMEVGSININKIVQTAGDTLILNGGNSLGE